MKKKIIYLSYNFMGYEKEIIRLLEEVMGFEVYFINAFEYEYKYKNSFEKLLNNFYYKPFYKKNLKETKFNEEIIKKIEEIGEIDYIFCIRADIFSHEIFEYLKKKNKPMYLHHWDSFSFVKKQIDFLKYFDYISSFDKKEAKEYNMKFVPNFYLEKNIKNIKDEKYDYEYFTIMKYDKRCILLEKLGKYFKENNVSYKFIAITKEGVSSEYIEISKEYIPLEKTYELLSKSKGIVEIGHTKDLREEYQGGLSFRIADAIGNKQKIITNYDFIKEYDIFNDNNVYILENNIKNNFDNNIKNSIDIFLKKEYKEYPEEIYKSYSGENWIKKIFNR